jgi:hypothetical protein
MAWEWVAPVATGVVGVAGVYFTWLTGAQARAHLDRMADRGDATTERARLLSERRAAYFGVLGVAELDLRRDKYRRDGELVKLRQIEERWPKAERVSMARDATLAVEVFGSEEARGLVERWRSEVESDDSEAMIDAYRAFLDLCRRELTQQVEAPQGAP